VSPELGRSDVKLENLRVQFPSLLSESAWPNLLFKIRSNRHSDFVFPKQAAQELPGSRTEMPQWMVAFE
jgi:hypothetical protein